VAGGKIATYILPCFAPLAILIALGLRRYLDGARRLAFSIGTLVLAAVMAVGAAVLLLNQVTDVLGDSAYGTAETWKWAVGAMCLFAASASLVLAAFAEDSGRRLRLFFVVPLLCFAATPFLVPDQFGERKLPGPFLNAHADKVAPETVLVSAGALAVSMSWAYKRDDVYFLCGAGELDWGLEYEDSRHRRLTVDQLAALLDRRRGSSHVVLFDYGGHFEQYRDHLPQPLFVAIYGRFVLVRY
jgi:4-amino-4-deoxy-L-arabinose transferase